MAKRLLLFIVVLLLAGLAGKFVVYSFAGTALIEYGQTEESRALAVSFAPANAEVLAARGRDHLYRADPIRMAEAIQDWQHAVAASPRDYRYWLELGRAYDLNGEVERAETSLQRAVELAPKFFEPRWALANFRLRAGRRAQALDDFKAAIALSGGISSRPDQAATLSAYEAINQALDHNLDALRRATPADQISQTYLASYLASNHALDAALEIWRRLSNDDPDTYRSLVFQLLSLTQAAGRFEAEREVWQRFVGVEGRDAGETSSHRNLMTNGGFEQSPLGERYPALADPPTGFDWIVRQHAEVRVERDGSQAHTGAYGLHLTFAAAMRSEFREVSQLIAVEPSRRYRLSYFVKTRRMPSIALFIDISDATQPGLFSVRSELPRETSDWREVSLALTTPPAAHALRLTIRSPRLVELNSANLGEVWLDDFRLERAELK